MVAAVKDEMDVMVLKLNVILALTPLSLITSWVQINIITINVGLKVETSHTIQNVVVL